MILAPSRHPSVNPMFVPHLGQNSSSSQRPDSSEICLYLVRAPPVISTDSSAEGPFGWRDVRPVVVGLWH